MLAMQYGFTLPADYDMGIIRRRIADRGHLTDDFPGLVFKAYLYAVHDDREVPGGDNLYAPFYLWHGSEGMSAFLGGAGFAALSRDFGRPAARTWMPWYTERADDLRHAACATRELVGIPRHADLGKLRKVEAAAAQQDRAAGALAALGAYDPASWHLLRFRLWPTLRTDLGREGRQLYRVGHISQPGAPH